MFKNCLKKFIRNKNTFNDKLTLNYFSHTKFKLNIKHQSDFAMEEGPAY